MCLREICDYGVCQKKCILVRDAGGHALFTRDKQLISLGLKLLNRDLSTEMRLQMCVEPIVPLRAGFAGGLCKDTGTEFLKVHAYPVESKTASAVGTFNFRQWP
jgi:hypothetical protein